MGGGEESDEEELDEDHDPMEGVGECEVIEGVLEGNKREADCDPLRDVVVGLEGA